VHDGALFGVALVAGGVVAALLARAPVPRETPLLRRAALAAAAVVVAAVVVVGAVNASTLWDEFTSTSVTQLPNTGERFRTAGSNHRWVWWKQAWRGWEAHPVEGTGAASFELTNLRYRTTYLDQAREPHDLPLQFLSEAGLVGAALFLLALGTLVVVARRREPHELALALLLPAFALHGLLEIDWDFLAVAAPAFLAAGAVAGRPAEARRPSPFAALVAAGAALALVSSFLMPWLADRWTSDAYGADPPRAVTLAKRARAVDPLSIDPLIAQAFAEESRGRIGRAGALFRKATEVQPDNPQGWVLLGRLELDQRCPREALPHLERYVTLDPQARPEAGANDYRRALRLVNAGAPGCRTA
jgi:tetratricopeptide (TPR) repeat protein